MLPYASRMDSTWQNQRFWMQWYNLLLPRPDENNFCKGDITRMSKKKILFLCTGNSCRSQMAEGFAKTMGKDVWEAHSAGINPVGLNPNAVRVMAEAGLDISNQTSKPIDPDMLAKVDLVITLCGDAAESCLTTSPGVLRIHWPIEDPAKVTGKEDEIIASFRAVRDEVRKRVEEQLKNQSV
jgi:arsenate reductase